MKLFDDFVDIPGFEGLYQINKSGIVKSLARFNPNSGRAGRYYKEMLKTPRIDEDGYLRVTLCKDGKLINTGIHRLLALTFIPNPNNYNSINHKDENKLNNNLDNLEWCTIKYNINYNNRQARISEKRKKKVAQYTLNGNLIKIHDSVNSATSSVNGSKCYVIHCCKGLRTSYKNYKWKYYEVS